MSTHEYLSNDYFLLTLTFGVYFLAKLVQVYTLLFFIQKFIM